MMNYKTTHQFEFGRIRPNSWTIQNSHIEFLKNCKTDLIDGYYGRKVFQITEFKNLQLIESLKAENQKNAEFLNDVYVSLSLIILFITKRKIKSFDKIKSYHIKLLNELYFYDGNSSEFYEDEDFGWVIQTSDKRPFGNSGVEVDILNCMKLSTDKDSNFEIANRVYNKVFAILFYILKFEDIKIESFKIYNSIEDLGDKVFGKKLLNKRLIEKYEIN